MTNIVRSHLSQSVRGVLVACALLVLAIVAPNRASADEPSSGEGGPVTGSVRAANVVRVGWCAVACIDNLDIGENANGQKLSAPDYYPIAVASNNAFTVASDRVATGTYKIAFYGETDPHVAKIGYLRRGSNGVYAVTSDFASATSFTVQESQALDLGMLSLVVFSTRTTVTHSPTLVNRGGEASNVIRLTRIPKTAKVVVRSYGCGKLQTRRVVTRPGTFRLVWKDRYAYRHYGAKLRLQVSVVQGAKVKSFPSRSWNVGKFDWHC